MFPFVSVLGFQIPAYGLMNTLGMLVAAVYLFFTNRGGRCGRLPGGDLVNLGALAAAGALVGGIGLYALTMLPVLVKNWAMVRQNLGHIPVLLFGGMVFYGGLLGGLAAVWWYCKRYQLSFALVVGLLTPAVPLFHVFGRIGCFLGGCCWGMQTPFGVVFTASMGAPNGVPLLPVQLIEAGLNLLLFLLLAVLARRLQQKWVVLPLYLVLYSVLRFVLEFFRGDRIRGVYLLSTSQWVSLGILLAVLLWYLLRRRAQHTAAQPPQV